MSTTLHIATPSAADVHDLGDGYCASPVLLDDREWASFTPCHLRPVVRRIAEFAGSGELTVRCPARGCGRLWAVAWDPWDAGGRGFALWVE